MIRSAAQTSRLLILPFAVRSMVYLLLAVGTIGWLHASAAPAGPALGSTKAALLLAFSAGASSNPKHREEACHLGVSQRLRYGPVRPTRAMCDEMDAAFGSRSGMSGIRSVAAGTFQAINKKDVLCVEMPKDKARRRRPI